MQSTFCTVPDADFWNSAGMTKTTTKFNYWNPILKHACNIESRCFYLVGDGLGQAFAVSELARSWWFWDRQGCCQNI